MHPKSAQETSTNSFIGNDEKKVKVAFFDEAAVFGGSLQVLSTIFQESRGNPSIECRLITCAKKELLYSKFEATDILLAARSLLTYVHRARLLEKTKESHFLVQKLVIYSFSLLSLVSALPHQLRILASLARYSPDILHINNSYTPLLAAKLLRIPVIWHLHGVPTQNLKPWQRMFLRNVAHFVSISNFVSNEAVRRGYPAKKMLTLLNPIPTHTHITPNARKHLTASYDIPEDHFLVAHIGRIIEWKGQLEFLKAFRLSNQKIPNMTALIIGDDSENFGSSYSKQLKEYTSKYKLTPNIKFTGHIDSIIDVMANVDLVVHSSIEPEPFGLVIIEAMSVGAPVIAADRGAPCEIIESNVTGILANPECAEALSEAITYLLKHNETRLSIAKRGKDRVHAELSASTYVRRLINLYKEEIVN